MYYPNRKEYSVDKKHKAFLRSCISNTNISTMVFFYAFRRAKKLSSRVIIGTRKQAKGKSVEQLSKIRDEYLVKLQKLRKKYEDKIRK